MHRLCFQLSMDWIAPVMSQLMERIHNEQRTRLSTIPSSEVQRCLTAQHLELFHHTATQSMMLLSVAEQFVNFLTDRQLVKNPSSQRLFVALACHQPVLMGSIDIIKPLPTALGSAVITSWQHREKKILGNTKNQTWGCWMRSKYATSVLCSPPPPPPLRNSDLQQRRLKINQPNLTLTNQSSSRPKPNMKRELPYLGYS